VTSSVPAISVMKCALSLNEPGQEVTLKVLDLTHLINYPVTATTQAGSVGHKAFHRPGLKAEKSPRRASSLCSVASHLAGQCANPDPPQGIRCGRRGSFSFHRPKLRHEAVLTTQPGLISVALIGQAVGLLALTNIDDDLDRKCVTQSEVWLRPLDPRPSVSLPDHHGHKSFRSDGSRGVRQVLHPADQSDDCHQK
jgi:hypothetical protein